MKVLLDHNLPIQLRPLLTGCDAFTAREMIWDRLANGLLLRTAEEAGFAVMITADKNICHQQNNCARKIALVVLSTNDWPSIRGHAEAILSAVLRAQSSGFEAIDIPPKARRARAIE